MFLCLTVIKLNYHNFDEKSEQKKNWNTNMEHSKKWENGFYMTTLLKTCLGQ